MGCNCRKTKKVFDAINDNDYNGKNLKGYIIRSFQGILVFVILFIMFPFILMYLLIVYIISGSNSIYIPKFISKRLI